jgi:hypothetical protein
MTIALFFQREITQFVSIGRNEDASKKIFVATGILVFDFELFIGDLCDLLRNIGALFAELDKQGIHEC